MVSKLVQIIAAVIAVIIAIILIVVIALIASHGHKSDLGKLLIIKNKDLILLTQVLQDVWY